MTTIEASEQVRSPAGVDKDRWVDQFSLSVPKLLFWTCLDIKHSMLA